MPDDAPRPRLTPAMADIRRAVRESLAELAGADATPRRVENAGDSSADARRDGQGETAAASSPAFSTRPLVLVALSGGADSLALAAATAFEAPRAGVRAGAVVVDHALQDGSDAVAARAGEQARALGLDPVRVVRVEVGSEGGPEAAAREARYRALDAAAAETGASTVLLAHTLDDQAETVLLGLARGSGASSLQGMAPASGRYRRPLLGIRRTATRQACVDQGLEPWDDPHNLDPSYARVRVRERVLPVLESELGPGVAEALARTAEQAREDSEAFHHQIEEFIEDICEPAEAGIAVSVAALAANPAALRQRIIRFVVLAEFGVSLTRTHTLEVARLVTNWHGQAPIDLPGLTARREGSLLIFAASEPVSDE